MKLLNTNRFELAGTNGRFVHLATVIDGLHEYMCMFDLKENKCYIEELVMGDLTFIADDKLVRELAAFLVEHHITDVKHGLPVAD